ncbi:pre-mRNA-splicing factor CWC25 homolog [Daphnia pulicaria]|uniref:pre-mRNA-splicing factor CWC25 homolog n=1 Tax=Daphnia pulicaria TaxID=35523 RepID=UPI001EEC7C27|nr:pre-mRNA-splicing factor CWC25 homolog [Daphnia pulicaria]
MDEAPKLDWMYAGPAGHVNTDEYLTGRAVDKTFEQFKLGGAEPLNLDLPAPTLPREKSSVPRIQVDVARKVQEDPLLTIRRQEEERRATLREQMLIQQRLTSHSNKTSNSNHVGSKNRTEKRKDSDSSDSSDLDSKLASKLKQLKKKESLDEKIAKKLQKLKKRRDSTSSSSSSDSDDKNDRHGKKRTSYDSRREREPEEMYHHNDRHRKTDNYRRSSSSHTQKKIASEDVRRRPRSRSRSRSPRSREVRANYKDTRSQPRTLTEGPPVANKRSTGMKLNEEELEKRRREMMQHAVVREQERKVKVDKYRKEVEDEAGQLNSDRPKEAAFVKKQLATVTANTTVEARIKANVFNIQRSVNSMDSNFARR